MCSFDVQQTVCCNDMRFWCAAKYVSYLFYATPRRVIAQEKQRTKLGGGAIADGETRAKNASVDGPLRAVYTRVFCIRFPVRDCATAQHLPLLFSRHHVRDKAKEAVGQ
jgi:hypothetical protein